MSTDEILAADPAFQTVCDARRDAWIASLEAEHIEGPGPASCGVDETDEASA